MDGTLAAADLEQLRKDFSANPVYRLAQNAVTRVTVDDVAINREIVSSIDHSLSTTLDDWKVTNQERSGRCWLFAGLNLLRVGVMRKTGLKDFEFSQNYAMFWDKLERANYFLEAIIETADRDLDDRTVAFLQQSVAGDGGQWNMFAALVAKHGLVPKGYMPETQSSSNTARMNSILRYQLHQGARTVRSAAVEGPEAARAAKAEVMRKYLTLSDRASGPQSTGVRDASILIWPESAFPFFLTREADAMAEIADLLPKSTVLITGSVRAPDLPPGARITRAYNSIYVIDHDGSILSVYDKLHLVPFGEYLPLQDWLEALGLEQLTRIQGGFIPGKLRHTLQLPGAPPALPLICYEIVFPGDIAADGDRPGWIVNLTNDGWFGISTGPYQHLQQARLRAIEQGLPVVRAANTGISAVIDPMGRIVARLGLGIEGVLDSSLPSAIRVTVYAGTGDIPVAVVVAAALIYVVRRRALKQIR